MASIRIMQGDSYALYVNLTVLGTGQPITPDLVAEVEICVGDIRKLYSAGDVRFDDTMLQWFFVPTQEETFSLEAEESYPVQVRVRFRNENYSVVKGIDVGNLVIVDANSEEVI